MPTWQLSIASRSSQSPELYKINVVFFSLALLISSHRKIHRQCHLQQNMTVIHSVQIRHTKCPSLYFFRLDFTLRCAHSCAHGTVKVNQKHLFLHLELLVFPSRKAAVVCNRTRQSSNQCKSCVADVLRLGHVKPIHTADYFYLLNRYLIPLRSGRV